MFSNLNLNCSKLSYLRNLQEQVKKAFCYQKLFWPFTVWTNCSSDLKFFLITRTFFSHSRSKQFWRQNTISPKKNPNYNKFRICEIMWWIRTSATIWPTKILDCQSTVVKNLSLRKLWDSAESQFQTLVFHDYILSWTFWLVVVWRL